MKLLVELSWNNEAMFEIKICVYRLTKLLYCFAFITLVLSDSALFSCILTKILISVRYLKEKYLNSLPILTHRRLCVSVKVFLN